MEEINFKDNFKKYLIEGNDEPKSKEDIEIRTITQRFEEDDNINNIEGNYDEFENYIKTKLSNEELKYLKPITNLVMAGNFW